MTRLPLALGLAPACAAAPFAAFQNTEYFRVARGTVVGFDADGTYQLTNRLTLSGQLMRYAHVGTSGMDAPNWTQTGALLHVDWVPGASADRIGTYR